MRDESAAAPNNRRPLFGRPRRNASALSISVETMLSLFADRELRAVMEFVRSSTTFGGKSDTAAVAGRRTIGSPFVGRPSRNPEPKPPSLSLSRVGNDERLAPLVFRAFGAPSLPLSRAENSAVP